MQRNTNLPLKEWPFQKRKSNSALEKTADCWLNILLNAVADIWVVKDGEGRWQMANELAVKLFGLQELDYQGKTDRELAEYSELYRQKFWEGEVPDETAWQEKTIACSEREIAIGDSEIKTFQIKKIPLFRSTGSRQGMVVIWRDISEGKQIQQEFTTYRRNVEEILKEQTAGMVKDINDLSKTEQLLKASEAKYKVLFNILPLGIAITDKTGNIIEVNKAAENILGIAADDNIINKYDRHKYQTIRPDGKLMPIEEFASVRELKENGTVENIEKGIFKEDSQISWISVTAAPIPLPNYGVAIGYVDITERKLMEEALRDSEERFRNLVNNAPLLMWTAGVEGYCNFFNQGWLEFRGRNLAKEIGNGWLEGVHPEDVEVLRDTYLSAVKHHLCFEVEYRLKRHDGEYRWILNKGVPRFDRDGSFEGYIGLCFEITKRKQAEAALRESEERFRQMTENCNEVFWIATADMSQLLYISPAYEKIWGRSCASLYLQAQLWLDVIHSDDRDRVLVYLQNSLTNTNEDKQYYQEYRIVRPDDSICWIGDRCFPIRNDSGQIYRLAGIARDITDRKLAEEAIRHQNEREQLVAAMTQRIRRTLNLDEILNTAVREVQQLLGCDRVLIYRVWPEGTGSVVKEASLPDFRSILGMTFSEEVFPYDYHQLYFQGRIRAISDVENSNIAPCLVDFLRELEVKAKIVVPLIHGEELWGLLIAHQCHSPRDWQSFEITLLSQLSTQLAIAIQQASLFEQLQAANQELNRLARLDGLTKVANRRYFDEYLEREWRRLSCEQLPLSLILCDLDYFKNYNDTYGHQAGDECLQQVAKAIERSLKHPEDFVARYGGEEFAIVLPNTKAEGALKVAREIRCYLAQLAIAHAKSEVSQYVTLSLGVAVMVPTPNFSPERLIYTADLGLYEAKSQGRDRAVLKICR